MPTPQLKVRVLTPEGVLYDGAVLAVSGVNETGPFAILPQHANFISIITGFVRLHEGRQHAQEIKVERAVLTCRNNEVEVYTGFGLQDSPVP